MIEYYCKECKESELIFGIIPKKKCTKCGKYFEAIEQEEE